ncbi:MAG TPA: pyruvoyl-dependent arginine decarboxylase [Thermomicrobiales bacterium]
MGIAIVGGVGRRRTVASSLDAALRACGVGDATLVPVLTAVVPPGVTVAATPTAVGLRRRGAQLPVLAAVRSAVGVEGGIAAAIGWYSLRDGHCLLVAQDSTAESAVLAELDALAGVYAALRDMVEARGEPFEEMRVETRVESTEVGAEPTTVAVIAVLEQEEERDALALAGRPGDAVLPLVVGEDRS